MIKKILNIVNNYWCNLWDNIKCYILMPIIELMIKYGSSKKLKYILWHITYLLVISLPVYILIYLYLHFTNGIATGISIPLTAVIASIALYISFILWVLKNQIEIEQKSMASFRKLIDEFRIFNSKVEGGFHLYRKLQSDDLKTNGVLDLIKIKEEILNYQPINIDSSFSYYHDRYSNDIFFKKVFEQKENIVQKYRNLALFATLTNNGLLLVCQQATSVNEICRRLNYYTNKITESYNIFNVNSINGITTFFYNNIFKFFEEKMICYETTKALAFYNWYKYLFYFVDSIFLCHPYMTKTKTIFSLKTKTGEILININEKQNLKKN